MDKTLLLQMFATEDGLEVKEEQGETWVECFEKAIAIRGLEAVRLQFGQVFSNLAGVFDDCLIRHYSPDDQKPLVQD